MQQVLNSHVLESKQTPPSIPSTASPSATPQPEATAIPVKRSIYVGMWTQGMWDDPSLRAHPEKLLQTEQKIQKKVAIAHFYTGWENLSNPALIALLE